MAGTGTRAPVRGLRAERGARRRFSKVPNPGIDTRSPRETERLTAPSSESMTCVATRFDTLASSETYAMRSPLFKYSRPDLNRRLRLERAVS